MCGMGDVMIEINTTKNVLLKKSIMKKIIKKRLL